MPTAEQQSALFKAAEAGDVQAFKEAAANVDADIRQLKADNGANCLHIAAHAGRTELCEYLLDHLHFDINEQDGGGEGSTPLVLALAGDHWATAEALLAHGADVNRRGASEGAVAPLHLAVAARQLELAGRLLAAGADSNATSSSGSPLMLAAARSDTPMVELLLGSGADVREQARQGLTPLFMAVAVGASPDCVSSLIKAGADANARALGAFTPLHVAAEGGRLELARVLLEAGADPEAKDEHGHTPARVAAMYSHRQLADLLLQRSGEAAGAGGLDAYMQSSKADLKEREERAAASGSGSGGAQVVRIPEPECPDEPLADTFKRKGNEMFVVGDFETAAKLYDLALSHWTKNAVVWSNRAACFLRLQRYEKALQDAQIARTLDPKYVKAWYREGRAAEGLKRWEDAATAFYQAAQLDPDNEEFIRLTKEAIMEGRKEHQAQQAAAPAGSDDAAAAAAEEGSAAAGEGGVAAGKAES